MRFILPVLITVVFLSSCSTSKDKETDPVMPASPLEGNWRQISMTAVGSVINLPADYGLTLNVTADSLHYYKHDTLTNAIAYQVTAVNNVKVITSPTTGYENYFIAYELNAANDTLNLYVPSFATTGSDNYGAAYVKIK